MNFKFKVSDLVILNDSVYKDFPVTILARIDTLPNLRAIYSTRHPSGSVFDYDAEFVERVGTLHLNGIQRLLSML